MEEKSENDVDFIDEWYAKNLVGRPEDRDRDHDEELNRAKARIENLKCDFVKQHGLAFATNVLAAREIVTMPVELLLMPYFDAMKSLVEKENSSAALIAEIITSVFGGKRDSAGKRLPRKKGHQERALEIIASVRGNNDKTLGDVTTSIVKELFRDKPQIISWYENLFELALCSGWTSYEVLTGDLWEDLVNTSLTAAKNVCNVEKAKKESKKFDLDQLFKYQLNLSNKMGTFMKDRHDFTNTNKIEYAFATAFGEDGNTTKTPENPIFRVEQKRHLFLHRGGVVDEKFVRNTKSQTHLGTRLRLTIHELGDDMDLIFNEGISLLEKTDAWVQKQQV